MATPEIVRKASGLKSTPRLLSAPHAAPSRSTTPVALTGFLIMMSDVMAVLAAIYMASHLRLDSSLFGWLTPTSLAPSSTLFPTYAGYVAWFATALLFFNHREGLYRPLQIQSPWNEQKRTVQACLTAGLLLSGAMYITHNTSISRAVVAYLVSFTIALLCLNRAMWRRTIYQRFDRGVDTKNVLIIGTSHIAEVLRKQLVRNTHLGRVFRGFIHTSGSGMPETTPRELVLGGMSELQAIVRQQFVDEFIIAAPCSTAAVIELVEMAKDLSVEVLVVPGFYDDLTPEAPIEYMGDFPVVVLHRREDRVLQLFLKRVVDILLSSAAVAILAPAFLAIAIAVKLGSPGPVFYISDRIGRKGRVFPCLKFRTMVVDAERLKAELAAKNERDGILFKMKDDPRITRVGRWLRKYSLDELPQLLNVLRGDMSLVGPRPPIASEVARYELEHFKRLEVLPGLTGLWQVRARQDPSFERYVALDLAYVENWSLWLDLKILVRTAEVVVRGTGT